MRPSRHDGCLPGGPDGRAGRKGRPHTSRLSAIVVLRSPREAVADAQPLLGTPAGM